MVTVKQSTVQVFPRFTALLCNLPLHTCYMFPELATTNYLLQQIKGIDQSFIFEGLSHPETIPYYGVSYTTYASTAVQMDFYNNIWINRTGCWWKIIDKKSKEALGACGMNAYDAVHEKAEIGYWLLPANWGRGIMQEVLPAMITHLFANWKLHRLEAVVEKGNNASSKLVLKLGFTLDGVLRDAEIKQGKRITLSIYSLLATDHR